MPIILLRQIPQLSHVPSSRRQFPDVFTERRNLTLARDDLDNMRLKMEAVQYFQLVPSVSIDR